MINLLVDEAYAFDYLSILQVKHAKDINDDLKAKAYSDCFDFILNQIGKRMYEIYGSDEYAKLYNANMMTFDAVDRAKSNSILASEVDALNYHRYICKKALQNKFFNNNLIETKIGYNK